MLGARCGVEGSGGSSNQASSDDASLASDVGCVSRCSGPRGRMTARVETLGDCGVEAPVDET